MTASLVSQAAETAPRANHSLPMLLLRLREAVLMPLRSTFHQFGLSEQQARVLLILGEAEKLEMIALAEACCIQPPSLSRIIPKLRARGWIERQRLNDDLRRVAVELTPAGRELMLALLATLREAHAGTKHLIGETSLAALTAGLVAATNAMGDPILTEERRSTGGKEDLDRPDGAS